MVEHTFVFYLPLLSYCAILIMGATKTVAVHLSPDKVRLRASGIFGGGTMENKVEGKKYGVGNNRGNCWYCSDGYQYHRYVNQYPSFQRGYIGIKKATALRQR